MESEFLEARILHADIVEDAPVVEDVPSEGRADHSDHAGVTMEQFAKLLGRHSDGAIDGEMRVEVGLSDSYACALSRDLPFRSPDVGAPSQEVGRNANHDSNWRHGDALARLQRLEQVGDLRVLFLVEKTR